ncbi:MAG: polysaccharide pyruvyl transferase family protein [Thermoleophilia bacterium]|nr:polysaccharide pyruvyl transferase family protein [Thermoleophilia bacterium]
MRILVDNGEYGLVNKGDLAIIQVTVSRLRELWPNAEIGLVTEAPAKVGMYFPGVTPVPYSGPGGWPEPGMPLRIAERAPGLLRAGLDAGQATTTRARNAARPLKRAIRAPHDPLDAEPEVPQIDYRPAPGAVREADLVVCAGGGYMTDAHAGGVSRTLSILSAAVDAGIPTAMFGQGIGPLERSELASRAKEVLPRLELIALREGVRSPALLGELGVPAERVVVTGDDAIGLAVALRSYAAGPDLGINLRLAEYTDVKREQVVDVSAAVQAAANARVAYLSPIYVSEWQDEDRLGTLEIAGDYPLIRPDHSRHAPPSEVIERVGQCRVLVTSTYHAAVFALSQGIPTICLPRSQYYIGTFEGLANQFPTGCKLVPLDTHGLRDSLTRGIHAMWDQAPDLRSTLRDAAAGQVAASRTAYRRLREALDNDRLAQSTGERSPISAAS